jgi:hypothetical protein
MSETTSSSEPATGPVATAEPPPVATTTERVEPRGHSRLTAVAAWVGIVAGVVFIVAVVFFSGFFLGKHSGGGFGRAGHHLGRDMHLWHRGGPPPMGPWGPGSGGPGGPGAPGAPGAGPGVPPGPPPPPPAPSAPARP